MIIICSISAKIKTGSGPGFYFQSAFFLVYYYGNIVASCVILSACFIFKTIVNLSCPSESSWFRKLGGVVHAVLTSTLLGVFKMLPEFKEIDECDNVKKESGICKLCARESDISQKTGCFNCCC